MSNATMANSSNFKSAIKFDGRSILPPVMTDQCHEEMAMYKRQAIFTETRLKARSRQKYLVRVQSLAGGMNQPIIKRTTPTSASAECSLNTDKEMCFKHPRHLTLTDRERTPIQQSLPAITPDSLNIELPSPTTTPNVTVECISAAKTSPGSEAKDSGFSSQGQARDLCMSVVTTDPSSEELPDTMAEITDISDEDTESPVYNTCSVPLITGRPLTVAEQLSVTVLSSEEGDKLQSKLGAAVDLSARSSISATTSTTSTDDTTLQDTIMAPHIVSNLQEQDLECTATDDLNSAEKNTTKQSMDKIDATKAALNNTATSLLSRVAFNLEDEDFAKEGTQTAGEPLTARNHVSEADVTPVNANQDQSSSLTTDHCSHLESVPMSTENHLAKSSSVISEGDIPMTTIVDIHQKLMQDDDSNNPDFVVSTCALKPNVAASDSPKCIAAHLSKSTEEASMYTVSTDIDKYMQGSLETDTIHSSMTTLPYIYSDSVSTFEPDQDTSLIDTAIINREVLLSPEHPNAVSKSNTKDGMTDILDGISLSATATPTVDVISKNLNLLTNDQSELLSPIASRLSPERSESVTHGKVKVRRGSYTLDSPSPALLLATQQVTDIDDAPVKSNDNVKHQVKNKSSYILDSPSPALLQATQQDTDNEDVEKECNLQHPVKSKSSYTLDNPSAALILATKQTADTANVPVTKNDNGHHQVRKTCSYTLVSPSPSLLLTTHQPARIEDAVISKDECIQHPLKKKSSYTLPSASPSLLATQPSLGIDELPIAKNDNHQLLRKSSSYTLLSPSPSLLAAQQITDAEPQLNGSSDNGQYQLKSKSSYTLISPSPALLEATQHSSEGVHSESNEKVLRREGSSLGMIKQLSRSSRRDKKAPCYVQSEPHIPNRYELTSSMEDLKLKPGICKTLIFEDSTCSLKQSEHVNNQAAHASINAPTAGQSVPIGKREHLQRYLQTVSQLPLQLPFSQTSSVVADGASSIQSSPGDGTLFSTTTTTTTSTTTTFSSLVSSPGQVILQQPIAYEEATSSMTTGLSENSTSQTLQFEFENLQQLLLEQQQQQLSQLVVEQQRQQEVMQQEFVKYESMLLQSNASEQDMLLHEQLQVRQRELLQTQMAMQQKLRWQMQQQQLELQQQLSELKNKQEVQTAVVAPMSSKSMGAEGKLNAGVSHGGKGRRKRWQDKRLPDGWFGNIPLEKTPADSANTTTGASTDTTRSGGGRSSAACSSVSRSGVSVGSDPFCPQRTDSAMSDVSNHRKRVSFSTDIDPVADAGSPTSRSTSRAERSEPVPAGYYRVTGQFFPVPSIETLLETSESATITTNITSSTSTSECNPSPKKPSDGTVSKNVSSHVSKSNRGSPKSTKHVAMNGPKLTIHDQDIPPELHRKFVRVSAAVKGYLTRRLMASDKVGQLIKTIRDTAEFALDFQRESPIKSGSYTHQDKELVDRVLAQLTSSMYEIHEVFFEISVTEQMSLIAQTRTSERERLFKQQKAQHPEKHLSSATLKALERKRKAQAAERALFGNLCPRSCTPTTSSPRGDKRPDLSGALRRNYQYMMSRVLKPIQAHLSPIKPVKDTLNSNPLRSSYDKLYLRALKRAVVLEKKEQREKATLKHKPALLDTKTSKPRVISHLGPRKKMSAINSAVAAAAPPKRVLCNTNQPPRPKNVPQTHPWK